MIRLAPRIPFQIAEFEGAVALYPIDLGAWLGAVLTAYTNLNRAAIWLPNDLDNVLKLVRSGDTLNEWWARIRTQGEKRNFDTRSLLQSSPEVVGNAINALTQPHDQEPDWGARVVRDGSAFLDTTYGLAPTMALPSRILKAILPTQFTSVTGSSLTVSTARPYQAFGPMHRFSRAIGDFEALIHSYHYSVSMIPQVEDIGTWKRQNPPLGQYLSYVQLLKLVYGNGAVFREQGDVFWARVTDPFMNYLHPVAVRRASRHFRPRLEEEMRSREIWVRKPLHSLFSMAANALRGWQLRTEQGLIPIIFMPWTIEDFNLSYVERMADEYIEWLKAKTAKPHLALTDYGGNIQDSANGRIMDPLDWAERDAQTEDLPGEVLTRMAEFTSEMGWTEKEPIGDRVLPLETADYARSDGERVEGGDASVVFGLRATVTSYSQGVVSAIPQLHEHGGAQNTPLLTVAYGDALYGQANRALAYFRRVIPHYASAGEDNSVPLLKSAIKANADLQTYFTLLEEAVGSGPYPIPPLEGDAASIVTAVNGAASGVAASGAGNAICAIASTPKELLAYLRSIASHTKPNANELTILSRAADGEFRDRLSFRMQPRALRIFSEKGKALHDEVLYRGGYYTTGRVHIRGHVLDDEDIIAGESGTLTAIRDCLPAAMVSGRFIAPSFG